MRRSLITMCIAGVLALAPAAALARGHHHGHHQRGRHGHVRTERFGPVNSGAPSTNPSDNAGTVASFANGVLTLRLNDGSTVSGAVNGQTEIRCEAPEPTAQAADHGGDSGSGDNGSGDDNAAPTQTSPGTQPAEPNDAAENEAAEPNDNEAAEPNDNEAAEPNDNEAAEPNDNEAAEPNDSDAAENENAQAGSCDTTSLTPNAVVREAELRIGPSGATFKDVELVR